MRWQMESFAVARRIFWKVRWWLLRHLSPGGILGDRGIHWAIAAGDVVIEPFDPDRLGSNSYDVALGDELAEYDLADGDTLDAKRSCPLRYTRIPPEGLLLRPGILYLGATRERTESRGLRPDVAGKSSIGRLGIHIHVTAGLGDAGFDGYFTLEIHVVVPVVVYAGMPCGQVTWTTIAGGVKRPYGSRPGSKYAGQGPRPVASGMYLNFKDAGDE